MQFYRVAGAAEASSHHPKTVRNALESGELHGYQRARGGHWLVDEDCLRAWCEGRDCLHRMSPSARIDMWVDKEPDGMQGEARSSPRTSGLHDSPSHPKRQALK